MSPFKNKKHTKEAREKNRLAHLGKMVGEKHPMYGKHHTKETRKKISIKQTGRKLTREHIRNSLRRRPMSSLEIKFQQIIQNNNLPYVFVGNGKFFIERKNPDFINTNGEKIAIEVFCKKHKMQFRNMNIKDWKKERQEIFNKYGWKLIFMDETQVNENFVLNILKGGK